MKSLIPLSAVASAILSLNLIVTSLPAAEQEAPFHSKLSIDSKEVDRKGGIAKSYSDVVDKVSPSLVSIFISKMVPASGGQPYFYPTRRGQPQKQTGLGSGVIVTSDGYILTNNHVVGGADEIKVSLKDQKKEYLARVVGSDPSSDVAIIKIDANDLPVVQLADSAKVRVGDVVLAFGTPFGLQQTVSMGIVSALGRANVGIVDFANFIQTDASINPGNSGGALVDADGRVVGINTAIYSETGGNMGIGFAIPINMALQVVDSLFSEGEVARGFLGVQMAPISAELAEYFGRDDMSGVVVARVERGTPAEEAGFLSEDIITEFEGSPVEDYSKLRLKIASVKPGQKVAFKVVRDGRERVLEATLGKRATLVGGVAPSREELSDAPEYELADGIFVETVSDKNRQSLQLPDAAEGVVVTRVAEDAPEANARLAPGDVIFEIERERVASAEAAIALSKQAKGSSILVRALSGDETRLLVLRR
jgi:serine protease Do